MTAPRGPRGRGSTILWFSDQQAVERPWKRRDYERLHQEHLAAVAARKRAWKESSDA